VLAKRQYKGAVVGMFIASIQQ